MNITFQHLAPNSARTNYTTEGASLSARLHAAVHQCGQCPLKSLGINKTGSIIASKHTRFHKVRPAHVKKKKDFHLNSNDFGFICHGVSHVYG